MLLLGQSLMHDMRVRHHEVGHISASCSEGCRSNLARTSLLQISDLELCSLRLIAEYHVSLPHVLQNRTRIHI